LRLKQHSTEKTPDTFEGERTKLRGWLVQLNLYFRTLGWGPEDDTRKINYAKSLLRKSAEAWITPFEEERVAPSWENWTTFKEVLHRHFGDIDARETARNEIEKLRQGKMNATDYWNKLRLLATEAQFDEATLGRACLRGFNKDLQDAWAQSEQEFTNTESMAIWAIEKENRIRMVKHLQNRTTPTDEDYYMDKEKFTRNFIAKTMRGNILDEKPRNNNGTFREKTTSQGGEAMDLDAVGKRRFNRLPDKEFQRRRREGLCFRCGKGKHAAKDCRGEAKNIKIREMDAWRPEDP
jgi:hypothetical protein